jgi:hypothetical protein
MIMIIIMELHRLIENQKNLCNISILSNVSYQFGDKLSRKIIGNSLIKHAITIQNLSIREQFEKEVLTTFVNLKILKLIGDEFDKELKWYNVKELFLPSLQILKVRNIPINCLTKLIESFGR